MFKENFSMEASSSSKLTKRVKIGQQIHSAFVDLPGIIIMNIIARLPICSICACRCVCKLFLSLTSERDFTQLCSEMSPCTTMVFNNFHGPRLVEFGKGYRKSYKCILPKYRYNRATLVDCCKGLMCLMSDVIYFKIYRPRQKVIRICNPILGQYVNLPLAKVEKRMTDQVYAFGIGSQATSDYKVLRVTTQRFSDECSKAEVFALGKSVRWTSVGYAPYPYNGHIPAAALNGAIHWISDDVVRETGVLCAFDIDREQVQEIPFPPKLGRCNMTMTVAVLDNFVHLFDGSDPARISIWTVKENGKCWSLDYMLRTPRARVDASVKIHHMEALKDAEISRMCGQINFYLSGPIYKQILSRVEDKIYAWCFQLEEHEVYTPNFSPLHELVKHLRISKVRA